MKPSKIEQAVLEDIFQQTKNLDLKTQLQKIEVTERDHTGAGCYSKLSSSKKNTPIRIGYIAGPHFDSLELKNGGGTILHFKDGIIDELEFYTFDDYFPKDHSLLDAFTLKWAKDDLHSLHQI